MESKDLKSKPSISGIFTGVESTQSPAPRHPLMVRMKNKFIAGLLVIVPVMVAIWALNIMLNIASKYFGPVVGRLLHEYVPEGSLVLTLTDPIVTVTSVILAVFFTIACGYLSTFLFVRKAIQTGESIVQKIPIVKFFYNTPKEVLATLTAPTSDMEKRVVFIQFPREGLWCLGFATDELKDTLGEPTLVSIFLPTTPNPTSGYLLYVPPREIRECALSVEQGARLIISGGILSPDTIPSRDYLGLGHPPMPPIVVEELTPTQEQAKAPATAR